MVTQHQSTPLPDEDQQYAVKMLRSTLCCKWQELRDKLLVYFIIIIIIIIIKRRC